MKKMKMVRKINKHLEIGLKELMSRNNGFQSLLDNHNEPFVDRTLLDPEDFFYEILCVRSESSKSTKTNKYSIPSRNSQNDDLKMNLLCKLVV